MAFGMAAGLFAHELNASSASDPNSSELVL